MAKLIKSGARKPRIENGVAYTGNNYSDSEPHVPGVMPEMCYDLTVSDSLTLRGASYTARLTEAEMLHTMQEWLTRYNSHQTYLRRERSKAPRAA